MSSRKPGYVIGVIVMALILSIPQILIGLFFLFRIVSPVPPMRPNQIVGSAAYQGWTVLKDAAFWRDRFVYLNNQMDFQTGRGNWQIMGIDAETGAAAQIISMPNRGSPLHLMVFGDRMWLVGNTESFEVVDGFAMNSTITPMVAFGVNLGFLGTIAERLPFLWDGDPAFVHKTPELIEVYRFQKGTWNSAGFLAIPDFDREWMFGSTRISFDKSPLVQIEKRIQVRNCGDEIHLFVNVDGRLLYHKGIELDTDITIQPRPKNQLFGIPTFWDKPTSALIPVNTDAEVVGWSLVHEKQVPKFVLNGFPVADGFAQGMLIEGQAAALIMDNVDSNNPVGHLYRFDGTKWSEVAAEPFPFGSREFRTFTSNDGQRSFLLVTSSTGAQNDVYAVEATGFRRTKGAASVGNPALRSWTDSGWLFVLRLLLGIGSGAVLGAMTAIWMWWFTKNDYGFGLQTVKLASLGWRGIARIIDLGLIVGTSVGLVWLTTRDIDWPALIEAPTLKVDHPAIHFATNAIVILMTWLVVLFFVMVITQTFWGVTPGKWLCRLKTVRTSLRACGFARSLARELMFFVDCCNFHCWTPGIVSIAITDKRQRLGDLVAGTIVVESRSLARVSKTESI